MKAGGWSSLWRRLRGRVRSPPSGASETAGGEDRACDAYLDVANDNREPFEPRPFDLDQVLAATGADRFTFASEPEASRPPAHSDPPMTRQ